MYAFISAARPGLSADQLSAAHAAMGTTLHMFFTDVTDVDGAYEGVAERSYRVRIDGATDTARIVALAIQADQDAVLFVDDTGAASILNLRSLDTFALGQFREVSADVAGRATGYSVINGRYYVAS